MFLVTQTHALGSWATSSSYCPGNQPLPGGSTMKGRKDSSTSPPTGRYEKNETVCFSFQMLTQEGFYISYTFFEKWPKIQHQRKHWEHCQVAMESAKTPHSVKLKKGNKEIDLKRQEGGGREQFFPPNEKERKLRSIEAQNRNHNLQNTGAKSKIYRNSSIFFLRRGF